MTIDSDQGKPNPFDLLRHHSKRQPPVYIPAERAAQRMFRQIYNPFAENQPAFGLSDAQMQTLSRFASAAAAKEKEKVQGQSKSTAAYALDELLADLQGEVAIMDMPLGERSNKISSLHKVRSRVREEVEYRRISGVREARTEYPELGEAGEEAVLKKWHSYSRTVGEIGITADITPLVFKKMKVGGTFSIEEFEAEGKSNRYLWNGPDSYKWCEGNSTILPGVVVTIFKWSGESRARYGAVTLKLAYKVEEAKDNYRWFDATKPITTPPF